ncbi:MAG: SGNH/GDSL hydrolase family protein [Polaromonas sp.]
MKTEQRSAIPPIRPLVFLLALVALAAAPLSSVHAEEGSQRPVPSQAAEPVFVAPVAAPPAASTRWKISLANFAKADQAQPPASDGVLFVGSSTIRMWPHLSTDFRQWPILLNRGFGGSTMADCNALARELVIQYKPRQILVYAGDNDLAEGRSPTDVLKSFTGFVQRVRSELPGSRITYISIKPSPKRLSLLSRIRDTNALIAAYLKTLADVRYIDVFTPMLNAEGLPRPELFLSDRLHLNPAGYQLWQSVIASYLPAPPQPRANALAGLVAGPAAAPR